MQNQVALAKLNAVVTQGEILAAQGMERLEQEWSLRKDFIVRPDAVDIGFSDKNNMQVLLQANTYDLTPHSRGQLLNRAGIPVPFADKLIDHDLKDLLRQNVRTLLNTLSKDGLMVRAVNAQVKGIMSSSYKRIDSSPLFYTFIEKARAMGLVPYQGSVSDTRAFISFLKPQIYEINGDYIVFGLELRSSDYGNGAFEMNVVVLRLLCQNGLIGFDLLRKVHIGKRFDSAEFEKEGSLIVLSEKTVTLDLETVRSGLSDVMAGTDTYIKALAEGVEKKANEEVNIKSAVAQLRKLGVKKAVAEEIGNLYESQAMPVEVLPPMPGKWRLANAISFLAHKETGDAQKDLQDIAFKALIAA
jgi:hypothetical protein